MAATTPTIIKSDTLVGSELGITSTTETCSRGFVVDGCTAFNGDGSAALYGVLAAPGFPQLRTPHPYRPNLLLMEIQVQPISDTMVRANCIYQLPQYNGASAYIIEDNASLQSYTTTFLPGARTPIRTSWTDNGTSDPYNKKLGVPEDIVPMNLLRPVRSISVKQVILGRPKYLQKPQGFNDWFQSFQIPAVQDAPPPSFTGAAPAGIGPASFVGCVNKTPWLGLPAGFWLLTAFSTTISRFDGYYSTQATAITKNFEDWSEFGILQNKQTGRYVTVTESDVSKIRNSPYAYGVFRGNGVVRVGAYPPTDFFGLFGFQ
jgi:hypothetical protein